MTAIGRHVTVRGNSFWTQKPAMGTPARMHIPVMVEPYPSRVLDGNKTMEFRFPERKLRLGGASACRKSGFHHFFEKAPSANQRSSGGVRN